MSWYSVVVKISESAYGYWVEPSGKLIEVSSSRQHALSAYDKLGGKYPTDIDDYSTPYSNGWMRVEMPSTITGTTQATAAQAKALADLMAGLNQKYIHLDVASHAGTVELADLENVLLGKHEINYVQRGYQEVPLQGGSDW